MTDDRALARELEGFGMPDDLGRRRRLEQSVDHRFGKRVACLAVAARREPEIVLGPAQIDVGPEKRPVRAWLTLVRHADAARIHGAHTRHDAVELDVGVCADEDSFGHARQELPHPSLRRPWSNQLLVATRRAMTEPGGPEALDVDDHALAEPLERVERRGRVLSEHPALAWGAPGLVRPSPKFAERAFGVSAHEEGSLGERVA